MHDRRDYVIAGLAAGLLFCLGILVGQLGGDVLPNAAAQDGGFDPTQPQNPSGNPVDPGGIVITPNPSIRPGTAGRTVAPTGPLAPAFLASAARLGPAATPRI